jgi:hypothetical protein
MPGQDQRKTTWSDADDGDSESKSRSSWNDVYPTTNDKGVYFFNQRWMKQYSSSGLNPPSYTMPPKK